MATDLQRLAERVGQRRIECGLGIEPAARLAGMSKDTWKRVEAGKRVQDTSYAKIDRALHWAVGGCADILAGREPLEVEVSEGGIQTAKLHPEEIAEAVRLAVQTASIATTELTAPEIRALTAGVLDDLKRRGVV
jgi:transcriptional regulator with XRE-family HTH domain